MTPSKWYWSGQENSQSTLRSSSRSLSMLPCSTLSVEEAKPQHSCDQSKFASPVDKSVRNSPIGGLRSSETVLLESKLTLVRHIRNINLKMGRDSNACIRNVSETGEFAQSPGCSHKVHAGFRVVETTARSKPALLSADKQQMSPVLKRPVLPSIPLHFVLSRSSFPQSLPLSLSERAALQRSIDTKAQTMRTRIEAAMQKRLKLMNLLKVFPASVNEFRVKSQAKVSVHKELRTNSLRTFIEKEKKKVTSAREKLAPERQLTKEMIESQRLLASLEEQLVDRLAWVDERLPDSEDEAAPGVTRLTRDQIDAKITKMKADSKRRAPLLARTRNLPILSLDHCVDR